MKNPQRQLAGAILLGALAWSCSDGGSTESTPAATGGAGGSQAPGGSAGAASGGAPTEGTGGAPGSGGTSSGGTAGATGGSSGSDDAGETGGTAVDTPDTGVTEEAATPPPPPSDGGIVTPPGMVSIFDGKTLNGWDGDPAIWTVKDGAIDGLTQNGGQLIVSKDDYDNFRITGTARMPQSMNHLGVCFWGGRGGHGYNGCIDFVPPSGSIWDYGGLNGIRTYKYVWMGMPVNKADWHQFEILANLTTGVVHMGVDGHEFPVYTDTRLAKRKKGPIGLQIHAGFSEVEYKDLAVEVNPKEDRLLTTMGPPTLPN